MTVVTADLVESHRRIGLLESLVNHLRVCRICAAMDVMNCTLGKTLWDAAKPDIQQSRSANSGDPR
jgi:hypothetical protein